MAHPIHIIKTGDTFDTVQPRLGDFEDWIARGLGVDASKIRVVDVPRGDVLPDPGRTAGAVIAGSHAMVSDGLDWSLKIEAWVPVLVENQVPLLGICYGHQLLAQAMGGRAGYHPRGLEIGTRKIRLTDAAEKDLLFAGLSSPFTGHTTHSQTALTLPPGAVLLAENDHDPHHAFRLGNLAWGVQFHPEYTRETMTAYVTEMEGMIKEQGLNYEEILNQVEETEQAHGVLSRFGRLCR